MKIAVRYYSRTGNTKQIAETVAAEAGCRAETVEVPVTEKVDLLFLGGGIYWGKIPQVMKEYIKKTETGLIGRTAVFTTAGISCDACRSYQTYLRNHDFRVFPEGFFCMDKQAADEKIKAEAAVFARNILDKALEEYNVREDGRTNQR